MVTKWHETTESRKDGTLRKRQPWLSVYQDIKSEKESIDSGHLFPVLIRIILEGLEEVTLGRRKVGLEGLED